jgi:hypothetical protein
MIESRDRSGWFGASDTSFVMGNTQTATFKKWWLEKLGIRQSTLSTKAMKVGTQYEHKILDTIPNVIKDRQILIPELHLRVNLDGETEDTIHEVKTYKDGEFKVPKKYKEQVIVQMFASRKRKAQIDAYRLTEDDYRNYFNEIDLNRLSSHPVAYDEEFIFKYLERLKYLCECLEKGVMPK